jgi:hypothetical protein
MWVLGRGNAPEIRGVSEQEIARFELASSLTWNEKEELFIGDGHFTGFWTLNPHNEMSGDEEQGRETLETIVAGVIEGANVGGYSVTNYDEFTTAAGFQLEAPLPDRDNYGRVRFVLGQPEHGLLSKLPADIHVHEADRGSPVQLTSRMEQQIEFELNLDGLDVVYVPESVSIENEAGRFELVTEQSGDRLLVNRFITLSSRSYSPELWPQVRELLLAETQLKNRLILLK